LTQEIADLRKQISKLEHNIVELNTELRHTKEVVKKYNNLRDDMTKLAERMKAVEVIGEVDNKHYARTKKNTSISQDWIMIIVTLAMVGITLANILL